MRYLQTALLLLISASLVACGGGTEQAAVAQPGVTAVVDQPPAVTAAAETITLSGTGATVTEAVTLPWSAARVICSHNGRRNFVVTAHQDGTESLLVNVIGKYQSIRPLFGAGEVYFAIDADGDWTVTVEPLGQADGAPFAGSGPAVSGLFDAPASGPWAYSHDGSRNFVVRLHCGASSDLVVNEIGKVSGSTVVSFAPEPCFWDVEGDGNWSLAPE